MPEKGGVHLRDYELMFIISPEVADDNIDNVIERVSHLVTNGGGEVAKVDPWGRRKLAYPIDGFREGSYVLLQFQAEPEAIKDLERNLLLSEDILRHLLVRHE
ncbi:MAG: 30S ribosomal protein S6 [Chloroflexi bacterium]|nr:30S ribosomal protein S6 [Chloroflexota bacterium]